MKFVIFFLANLIASQAAPTGSSSELNVDELFGTAWEFQTKLNPRQQDIDNDLTEFRHSVSNVLKTTSKNALTEVEDNAQKVLELENPYRSAMNELKVTSCSTDLKELLTGITSFTGYKSGICVRLYDFAVDAEIQQANDLISVYDGIFTELQQLVVKAFSGKNQFSQQAAIIKQFEEEYAKRVAAWEEIKPDVELFIENLMEKIDALNSKMKGCMKEIQTSVVKTYDLLEEDIQTCIDIENIPLSKFKSYKLKTLAELLPNEDLSVL